MLGLTFQPTELMKIIFILTLAVFLVRRSSKMSQVKTLVLTLVITAVPMLLILKQPDLSSSLVVAFIMVVMIFAAGLSYRIIVPIILLFVPIGIVGAWYIQQPHNGL